MTNDIRIYKPLTAYSMERSRFVRRNIHEGIIYSRVMR